MNVIQAQLDARLRATLGLMRPLILDSSEPGLDLPGYVRAGSAVRRWGQRTVVIQDDVHALALLDEHSGRLVSLPLPVGADGRRSFSAATGNKALKLDLEACVALPDGRLLAFGSGSKPVRERVVVVTPAHEVTVIDAHDLYAALHGRREFAGSELNLEGALVVGDALRLFQRGNGAARDGVQPIDATADLALGAVLRWLDGGPTPALERVRQYDLGRVRGVRFGFTDAGLMPDGRVAFLAGAEDSPDTYHDGVVLGCRFGIIAGDEVRMTEILGADAAPSRLKLEGIDWRGGQGEEQEFVVVADMDDPDSPALIGTLVVSLIA